MNLFTKLLYFMFIIKTNTIPRIKPEFNYNVSMNMPSFRVCGSYCGPGWCNDKWISESVCDESAKPEHHLITGYSCADLCCQKHDNCCGKNKDKQKDCNTEIVDCLSHCQPLSLTCTFDGIPIPAGEIEFAMNIVKEWCCGSTC